MKKLIPFLLFCCSSRVYANSACDNSRDNLDRLYCLNKVYQKADKKLDAKFQKLHLIPDTQGKKVFKSGQLSWMKEKNESCSKRLNHLGFYVNLNCTAKTTTMRSKLLQNRIRECASLGCQNSRL